MEPAPRPHIRTRKLGAGLAVLALGAAMGTATQHFAAAEVSSGERPVLIPIEPCRLADTRSGDLQVGPRSVPLGANDTHTIDAQESATPCTGDIPADALALSLNVTALNATDLSFLTIWAGGDRPVAASLNPSPGAPPVPNAVTVDLSADQTFDVYNEGGSVDVVVDVNGYYVDHNHDDRYPTDAEAAAIARSEISTMVPKHIPLSVSDAHSGPSAVYSGNFGVAGVRIPDDTSSSAIYFSFVLPPDYTPDTTFYIDLLWTIDQASCVVAIQRSSSTIASPGRPSRNGGIEDSFFSELSGGAMIANTLRVPWVPEGVGTLPGDAIHVGFYRLNGSLDTCVADLVIQGASVEYE